MLHTIDINILFIDIIEMYFIRQVNNFLRKDIFGKGGISISKYILLYLENRCNQNTKHFS